MGVTLPGCWRQQPLLAAHGGDVRVSAQRRCHGCDILSWLYVCTRCMQLGHRASTTAVRLCVNIGDVAPGVTIFNRHCAFYCASLVNFGQPSLKQARGIACILKAGRCHAPDSGVAALGCWGVAAPWVQTPQWLCAQVRNDAFMCIQSTSTKQ